MLHLDCSENDDDFHVLEEDDDVEDIFVSPARATQPYGPDAPNPNRQAGWSLPQINESNIME